MLSFLNRDLVPKNSGLWTLAKVQLNGFRKPKWNSETKIKSGNQLLQRATTEERKLLGEPSKMIQELIKEYPKEGFTVWCISRSLAQKIKKRGNKISLLPLEILNYGYKHETIFYDRKKRFIKNLTYFVKKMKFLDTT